MFDPIAKVLGVVLKFIYDVAFQNYGLAIIIFTVIVRLAMLPLTLKQQKSTTKMQEIQPLMNDLQKRYKDDKEKLNQEMMKLYQEHNYNPASGCLPLVIQMPILLTLYWVIAQPLKFMLGKDEKTVIPKLVEVASKGLNIAVEKMGTMKELLTLNYFQENPDALAQVPGLLEKSELIDFKSFLGLHLGKTATYDPSLIFGPEWKVYVPLLILVLLATATTYISSKLAMPKTSLNQQNPAAGCSTNSMLYMGPVMTLMFSFQMPAGVILYWMAGYVFAIFQQLYLNKQRDKAAALKAEKDKEAALKAEAEKAAKLEDGSSAADNNIVKQLPSAGSKNKGGSGQGKKGGNKKGGGKKK